MDARTQERDLIERDLPGAISKDDVRPYYQPRVDLQTNTPSASRRWRAGSIRRSAKFRRSDSFRSPKAAA